VPARRRHQYVPRLLALLLLVSGLLALGTVPAVACSCAITTPDARAAESDAIFRGTADTDGFAGGELTFEVLDVWKGDLGPTVDVVVSAGTCTLPVPDDEPTVVYAYRAKARLHTNMCSSPPGGGETSLTALLGPPHAPDGSGERGVEGPPVVGAPFPSALVMLLRLLGLAS
jgi:hypothetical protein